MVDFRQMLLLCSCQLLASRFHSDFNLRNKFIKEITLLLISIFLHGKNYTAFYISRSGVGLCPSILPVS